MKSLKCRFCNTKLEKIFVDLGLSPLANSFIRQDMLDLPETGYPLKAFVCTKCFLVQLEEFETPQKIFKEYAYFSSYSDSWLKHAENYVNMVLRRFRFDHQCLVVEIASNDGYLLQYFKKMKIPVLGIEPAMNVAKVAEEKGIPTLTKFFGTETVKQLIIDNKKADLLIGNNVLAHVPNLNDFVKALKFLLKPYGIITMEFPHLLPLIQQNQFDTIYHEHFSYFSLFTVQKIFSHHSLSIFDVEELPTHGGSLRIYVKHLENNKIEIRNSIDQLLKKEEKFGLLKFNTYQNFSRRVLKVKKDLLDFFAEVNKKSKKMVCYGAPAKGNTLLNYCGIDASMIEYTVDRNPHKQGLFLPGTHIPIKNPKIIQETKPDYLLILPWNLKEEIMEQMNFIRSWGGKFVVPVPEMNVYL